MSVSTLSKAKMEALFRFVCEKNEIDIETEYNNYSRLAMIPLPFDGVKRDGCCALKLNHGLFTQCCDKTTEESELCKTCERGEARYGKIDDRISKTEFPFVDPRGKKEVRYGNVMEKLGISKEDAILAASQRGMIIKPEDFEVTKSTRGRPKKKVTEDVESSDEEKPKKKRGRPRKVDKVVTHNDTTELVTSLLVDNVETTVGSVPEMSESKTQVMEQLVETVKEIGGPEKCDDKGLMETVHEHLHGENAKNVPIAWKEKDAEQVLETKDDNVDENVTKKAAEKAAKKAKKEAEKAAKKAAKEAEKAEKKAVKEAEKAAEKAAKKAKKEAEKAAKKSEKSSEKSTTNPLPLAIQSAELEQEPMSPYDSGEEEDVSSIQIGGKVYLRSATDVLYDPNTHVVVGTYIPGEDGKEGTIINEDN